MASVCPSAQPQAVQRELENRRDQWPEQFHAPDPDTGLRTSNPELSLRSLELVDAAA